MPPNGPAQRSPGSPAFAAPWFTLPLLAFFGLHLRPTAAQAENVCVTHDQPNTLFQDYPNNATGVLNVTLAIIPIPLATAQEIIPSEYAILESAYRSLLPDFPADMYPVLLQAGHDHDIRYLDLSIPDFSRSGFEFPFLDFLGDGYSVFRWVPEQMITASNTGAIDGSEAYGTVVHPSTFAPECDAYATLPGGNTFFNATSDQTYMSLQFQRLASCQSVPYPLSFFHNVTNQPIFAAGETCDQMIRLFDTPLSQGAFAPIPVKTKVESNIGPFTCKTSFTGVFGFQITTPFIENNYLSCDTLKGYHGVDL
ncbi:hypothetical protein B0J13DRAFT_205170 [Dactylonectria estremocensis]|uniref:Uncharacterized protein n=1 Tax=Dactylonectria estremocensis TaxID=1079267 RepID=A0A9P9DC79_9HYPO|nr:hypothetical protein B0J13DRAFT_205170 [Dactylonectria estremocensis]